jgi:hypothetical protein
MGVKRRTYDGRITDYNTMTQQHLSNIFWYNSILMLGNDDDELLRQIDTRFGGEILPYKPVLDFKLEIKALHKRGFLTFNELENQWEVMYQNVVVGYMDETREQVYEVLRPLKLPFMGTALESTYKRYAASILSSEMSDETTE